MSRSRRVTAMVLLFALGILGVGGGVAGYRLLPGWMSLVLFGGGVAALATAARLATGLEPPDARGKNPGF